MYKVFENNSKWTFKHNVYSEKYMFKIAKQLSTSETLWNDTTRVPAPLLQTRAAQHLNTY